MKLESIITAAMDDIRKLLIAELSAQGHRNTGALEKSLSYEVKREGDGIVAVMTAFEYGLYVEFGVPASRIPYTLGWRKRGGNSKYIQGLVTFFSHKGLSPREALGAAFATARKHKREGMPTRGSYAFSSNGRRTGFTRNTLEQYLPILASKIGEGAGGIVEITIGQDLRLDPYKIAA